MKTKIMAVMLVAAMLATFASGCSTPVTTATPAETTIATTTTAPTTITTEGVMTEPIVKEVKLSNGTTVFVYRPLSDLLGTRPCTSPLFYVFGNENYTIDTARATAESSSLAQLAADEGGIIVFFNSQSGTWSEADSKAYIGINAIITDSTEATYVNGMTVTEPAKYAGSKERVYIYAEGAGADFVAKYNLFGPSQTTVAASTPASVSLFNLSALPTLAPGAVDVPVVAVNAPAGIEDQLKTVSPSGLYKVLSSDVTTGLDAEVITSTYADLAGAYRREAGVLHIIPNYVTLGINETIETDAISTGDVQYYQYIPEGLDMTKASSVPLVMIFHGGGNHAEYHAWASEWPLIGLENGFMVVAVNQHVDVSSDKIVELLEVLEAKYPAIDKTRIYASGFSMGGVKSWNIGMKHSDIFAGIIPCDAGYMSDGSASADITTNIMPLFYVAGGASMLPERPSQNGEVNNVDPMLEFFFKVNKVADTYAFDTAAGVWGKTADETVSIQDPDYVDTVAEISYYKSIDGNTYTALCNDTNKAHLVYAADSYNAWAFISKFSRNSDGTITIAE